MKKFEKITRNALYIVLPLVFFAIVHLVFAYGNWELSPSNWSEPARAMSAFCGLISAGLGFYIAYSINED